MTFNDTPPSTGYYIGFQYSGSLQGAIGLGPILVTGAAGSDTCLVSVGGTLRLSATASGANQFSISAAGNVAIAAPSSGIALVVHQPGNGSFNTEFITSNVSSNSSGVYIQAGTCLLYTSPSPRD